MLDRLRPPRDPVAPLKMHIETAWFEDGMIEQRSVDLRGEVILEFLNTKEAQIRKALIALGWTPPRG